MLQNLDLLVKILAALLCGEQLVLLVGDLSLLQCNLSLLGVIHPFMFLAFVRLHCEPHLVFIHQSHLLCKLCLLHADLR